jgi:Fe-S cluster biogenesis protein NfuA
MVGVLVLGCTGCVQTQVTRQIQIHKDANGKITGSTEVETATQMGAAFKFSGFEYLKAGPRETEPLKLY